MESHLSSIPADVRLEEVQPLNRRRLVAFFNCFMQKATSLLNDVVLRNEHLLVEIERQMRVMDVRLRILEKKVSEISLERKENIDVESKKEPIQVETPPIPENSPIVTPPTVHESPDPVPMNNICEKYFKMLKMGVPETAVKLKMHSEGVDPALLTAPRGIPPPPVADQQSDSSDSSVEFTDSE